MPHQLTRECRAIIEAAHHFVSVFAVAGSGKTTTLCNRVCHLISRGIDADKILVLSFSNKAVGVLKSRLDGAVPVRNIMTFHALGHSVSQKETRLKLATPKQRHTILSQTIKGMPQTVKRIRRAVSIDLRDSKARAHLVHFFAATEGSRPQELRLTSEAERFSMYAPILVDLRGIRKRYNRRLEAARLNDYGGMLRLGRRYLDDPDALFPYSHVLVDEAQDMDLNQARMLQAIARRVESVMVFGDPRQAIFGFVGSQVHDMRKVLGQRMVELPLSRSFRLTRETAAMANAIGPKESVAISAIRRGPQPTFTQCGTAREQERAIVSLIAQLKASGVTGDRIAVLGRTKAQLRLIEQALLAETHMIRSVYGESAPTHMEVAFSLFALMEHNVERLRGRLTNKEKGRLERRLLALSGLDAIAPHSLQKCRRDLQRGALAPSFSGRYSTVSSIYMSLLTAAGSTELKAARNELNRWQAVADRFDTVKPFRKFVRVMKQRPAATSTTIHGSKGDEWDYVIVVGLTDGSLPFYRELERGEIEEERRLFYVAVTRARERAYLFHAPFHHAPSGRSFNEPSQFLTKVVRKALQT